VADGPRPWFGCDKNGPLWRAYCEAWEHVYRDKPANAIHRIADFRGKQAAADLQHNMALVKRDYRGEIEDRAELQRLIRP
jgi:hypothetical protein